MTDILSTLLLELDNIQSAIEYKNATLEDLDAKNVSFVDSEPTVKRKKKFTCPHCETKLVMLSDQSRRKCSGCGYTTRLITTESGDSIKCYNNMSESSVMARVGGTGLMKACINKQVLQTSDTSKYRQTKVLEQITKLLGNSALDIPKIYLEEAVTKYCKIAQLSEVKLVFRGDGLRGILAEFIRLVCLNNGMTISSSELAKGFNIVDRTMTRARRTIHSLSDRGLVDISSKHSKLDICVMKACKSLKISDEYVRFIVDLIERAEAMNLHIMESTVEKTRCAGTICILLSCVKDLYDRISIGKVESACEVTQPTFMKYYKILIKHKPALVCVFKKHNIPMPKVWQKSVDHA